MLTLLQPLQKIERQYRVCIFLFSIPSCKFTDGTPIEIFGQAVYDLYEPSRFMDNCTPFVILNCCFRYV